MTQEELAEKYGLQTSYLAEVERGDRNIILRTLETMTKDLKVIVKYLIELDSPMKQLPIETEQLKLKSDIEVKLILDLANKIFETYLK